MARDVSIVIPVLNKLEFTRQCLDRIWRNTDASIAYEVIVVDNASTDGTAEWFVDLTRFPGPVQYHRHTTNLGFAKANNAGAAISQARSLLFLNNDTLVQPGWLTGMMRVARSDAAVGAVGITQLFPYTRTIYHTGIVFTPEGRPEHLYPHLDASLPRVNQEREYQAVMGACLLIERALFEECGRFDERFLNGYEDIDLCLAVRRRKRKVVCCTSAFIYHYGQISEGRTANDDRNAALFASKWSGEVTPDRDSYLLRDRVAPPAPPRSRIRTLADDCIYLADDLEQGSALTWINAELALALQRRGAAVLVAGKAPLSPTLSASVRRTLSGLLIDETPVGGTQIKWSHYWTRHLNLELAGRLNLEFFVINYLFANSNQQPWDFWLQSVRQNHHQKLPLSEFCKTVLRQVGVPDDDCHVWHPGYSREIDDVPPPEKKDGRFRFLTVTNSHDLERYNTEAVLDAYHRTFTREDAVTLVIKDYGASSGAATLRRAVAGAGEGPAIEFVTDFTDKRQLIALYKSSDAFVSAHRGEGYGMKILDAMACGLPVITPLFGGPTDYCAADNCFPVEFSLTPMGDCLDTRSLRITNQPRWAEVDREQLGARLRAVFEDREAAAAVGARGRARVVGALSWDRAADRLLQLTSELRDRYPAPASVKTESGTRHHDSPYWLGLRISVVIPTRDRKSQLLTCLDALARQSILPQEFEVIVVDDGSADGTRAAIDERRFPFALHYHRQQASGPGAARNLGIAEAAGELVLFLGDDIYADERLLEEHLLAHAARPDPGLAILGRIDWPAAMPQNAVMEYVCGDAALQFAYPLIPHLPALDHRFFYTSNISLKRGFLVDAAAAGVRFDSSFRRAAFEDSEFAFQLGPRGLEIQYVESARAVHDHPMDLDGFAAREFGAGEMAVVFYRKHPGQDDQLQVRWIADLVEPASAILEQPDFLRRLEALDAQTDTLLRGMAGSLEELMAIERRPDSAGAVNLSAGRLRPALHHVLRVIFDVERTRGKIHEWFSTVEHPSSTRAAQTLASVMRKVEFLNGNAAAPSALMPFDSRAVESLTGRLAAIDGMTPPARPMRRGLARLIASPVLLSRILKADRAIEAQLQAPSRQAWLVRYRGMRGQIRKLLTSS